LSTLEAAANGYQLPPGLACDRVSAASMTATDASR
jgi:hypothetical protein